MFNYTPVNMFNRLKIFENWFPHSWFIDTFKSSLSGTKKDKTIQLAHVDEETFPLCNEKMHLPTRTQAPHN